LDNASSNYDLNRRIKPSDSLDKQNYGFATINHGVHQDNSVTMISMVLLNIVWLIHVQKSSQREDLVNPLCHRLAGPHQRHN